MTCLSSSGMRVINDVSNTCICAHFCIHIYFSGAIHRWGLFYKRGGIFFFLGRCRNSNEENFKDTPNSCM